VTDEDIVESVAVAVSDGRPVDWASAERDASAEGKALVRHLRLISTLAAAERPIAPLAMPAIEAPRSRLFQAALGLAALKAVLGVAGWTLFQAAAAGTPPSWPFITNLVVFATASVVMFFGGRHDTPARHLGALFLLIASAFSDRLILGFSPYGLHSLAVVLRGLPADAFLAFALWRFVWGFPAQPLRPIDRRVVHGFLTASLVVGSVLLLANLLASLASLGVPVTGLARWAQTLGRGAGLYSIALFGVAAPALPYLIWKSRAAPRDERRRASLFAGSLVAAVAPMLIAVLLSPFVRFFDRPANRDAVGVALYICLMAVVPLTAYAVLVQRVIDFGLLVTRAMKHGLVRYAVWVATLSPLVYLALLVISHRNLTVSAIARSDRALAFGIAIVLCLVAPPLRRLVLRATDLRFLGAPPDYPVVLGRLERELRDAHGVRDVALVLERGAERAIRPRAHAVLIIDEPGKALIAPSGSARPLDMTSTLGRLLRLAREEVFTGADAAGPVGRLLPAEDRRWLTTHEFQLLEPLIGSQGNLLGVIALGGKDSGPIGADERLLLATMASQAAVVIENRCFREPVYHHLAAGPGRRNTIDWDDEPGALCPACRTLWPSRTVTCECGAATMPAALPLVVLGKFRVLRLIGAGGMGVVYLAIDIALDRKVAIKTLPRLTFDRIVRLQREARAMAAAPHPNLAMIFGVESWRGAPLLIVEYLEGGTMADRQPKECLSPDETAELGIVLADVLDRVHASGVLHRDIKPSNIGFTRDGVPKLLDFGIASLLDATSANPSPEAFVESPSESPLTGVDQIPGTPLYLSPEAIDGAQPDPSFDLWSLSLVLYEAMGGHHPFKAPTVEGVFEKIRHGEIPDLRTIRPGTPAPLAALFARALSRNPADRPRHAAELRNWLQRLRSDLRAAV
jgi:GAF domain-containing protein